MNALANLGIRISSWAHRAVLGHLQVNRRVTTGDNFYVVLAIECSCGTKWTEVR